MQRKSGNYQILSGFQYYTPGISGMFALLLWLLVGSLLGSFVTVLVASVAGLGASAEYSMLISYPLMFVPPLIYASYKSHRNAIFDTGFALDNNHFGNSGGWVAALVAAASSGVISQPLRWSMRRASVMRCSAPMEWLKRV